MKRKTSLTLLATLTVFMLIIAAILISLPSLTHREDLVAANDTEHIDKIDDEVDAGFITILPDDYLIIEVPEEITGDNDETTAPDTDDIGENQDVDNVTPDEDVTTPDEEVTAPDEDATAPDEEVTAPDKDATTPDEKVTAPDEDVTAPDEEVTAPDEDATTPDEEVTAPDEDATTPDEKVTTPDEDDNNNNTSEEEVTTPDEDDEEVNVPEGNEDVTPPSEDVTEPDKDEDNSDEDVTTPDEEVTTPDKDNNDTSDEDETDGNTDEDVTTPDEDTTTPDEDETGDNNVEDNDSDVEDKNEPTDAGFVIVEDYKNSMADGSGAMLWNLNVSYYELNASDLLAQHGLYLVFKSYYTADGEVSSNWYSFAHAFYNEETESYTSTGYLNGYVHSLQFAVVDVAPDDTELGGYNNVELSSSNFKAISGIFYNNYFNNIAVA
jgi:hypothetical protein